MNRKHFVALLAGEGKQYAGYNWYVDSLSGDDSRTGKTAAQSLKTIGALVAKSILPGHRVGLKCGSVFRETLTIPSSGEINNRITYGSYGAGDKPIISGADVISGWNNSWSTDVSETYTKQAGNSDITGDILLRVKVPINALTINGSSIRITLEGAASASGTISAVYIGEQAVVGDAYDMKAETVAQFLFSGSGGTTVPQAGTITSDILTYAFDKTKAYWISIGLSSGKLRQSTTSSGFSNYFKGAASADAGTADVSGMTGNTNNFGLYSVEVFDTGTGSQANTWAAACPVNPTIVFFDSNIGNKKDALVELATDYDFYWSSGLLFTYVTTDTDPDTKYTQVEAAQRSVCVSGNSKEYITIKNIHTTKSNISGFVVSGTDTIVEGCTVDYIGINGILTNSGSDGSIIQRNTITQCWNRLGYGAGGEGYGISASGGVNMIVRYNDVSYNHVGIRTNASSPDLQIHYNLVYNNRINGIDHVAGAANHPVLVYNNTILNNPGDPYGAGHGLDAQGVNGSWVKFKNNLIVMDYDATNINVNGISLGQENYSGIDLDYNLVYSAGSTGDLYRLVTAGTPAVYNTLPSWKTALSATAYDGKAEHDVNANPLVVSLETPDLHIQAWSPAIGAGIDVGILLDYDGRAVSNPPSIGCFEPSG